MHTHRGVEVRIGVAHNRSRGPAGGQARDVNSRRIDGEIVHDLTRDAGDQRRFAAVAPLVGGIEPIPALLHVGRAGLGRVCDQAGMDLSRDVHACSGGEIIRRLRAAVQHDDQRNGLPVIAGRDIQFVGTRSRLVAERQGQEVGGLAAGFQVVVAAFQGGRDSRSAQAAEQTLQGSGCVRQATGLGEMRYLLQILR